MVRLARVDFSADSRSVFPLLVFCQIVEDKDFAVEHYYKGGDHSPAHVHVVEGWPTTKIGTNRYPLAGKPELTSVQRQVVEENKSVIRNALHKLGRRLVFMEEQ